MKKIIAVVVLSVVFITSIAYTVYAGTAIYTGEKVDGMYKICYYDYCGSTVAITKRSYELCPLSIQVD